MIGALTGVMLCVGLVTGATVASARGDWGQASPTVRQQVVSAINWTYTDGGKDRAAECFWVETSPSHPGWATATFWSGMPEGCNPSDGFGVQAFRRSAGMWLPVASISGIESHCRYEAKPSAAAIAALKDAGMCR